MTHAWRVEPRPSRVPLTWRWWPGWYRPIDMADELLIGPRQRPARAWLSSTEEANAYEGIRRGDEAAFRAIAEPLQPVLHRLSELIVRSSDDAEAIIVETWAATLPGLDMFRWHTPFATWVARMVVAKSRARVAFRPDATRTDRVGSHPATPPAPGPPDWSDLPWSARWQDALPTMRAAQAALPLPQREVVHVRDVEQWPVGRICDVLGLPKVEYERLLAQGRRRLRDSLAPLVGASHDDPHAQAQTARTAAVLRAANWPPDIAEPSLDRRTIVAFRRWRAGRVPAWRRVCERLPLVSPMP